MPKKASASKQTGKVSRSAKKHASFRSSFLKDQKFQAAGSALVVVLLFGIIGYSYFGNSHAYSTVLFFPKIWANNVNVRLGPGTQYAVVKSLGSAAIRDACFQVVGGSVSYDGYTNDNWVYLPYQGGWVNGVFTTYGSGKNPLIRDWTGGLIPTSASYDRIYGQRACPIRPTYY